jgi:uncharacterized protein (DUF2062 family)
VIFLMSPVSRTTIARWVEALLHLQDSPPRLAAALAFGVAMGFTPFLGLQVLIGVSVAFLLRLNRVAVLAGMCANLPWIMVPWYAATTALAGAIMGVAVPADIGPALSAVLAHSPFSGAFWTTLVAVVRPWLVPFIVGPTVGGLLLGGITYPVALALIRARRRAPSTADLRARRPAGSGLAASGRPRRRRVRETAATPAGTAGGSS